MADNSKIEWTDATWNPIRARRKGAGVQVGDRWRSALPGGKPGWYCEHVSSGCEHCYAEGMNHRLGTGLPFKPGHRKDVELFLDEQVLLAPLRWKKPRLIFVCSMTDLFGSWVTDEWLDRIFAVMALCPQHVFQCLTKRPARMREYFCGPWSSDGVAARVADATWAFAVRKQLPEPPVIYEIPVGPRLESGEPEFGFRRMFDPKHWPPPHVWLGVSAEDQAAADERIPLLLDTPAAVRFVSLEPLLGPINLDAWPKRCWLRQTGHDGYATQPGLDWVIVGGESGPHARPMDASWARSLRDQCQAAGVPFFFKQWGEHAPYDRGRINSQNLAAPGSLDAPMQRFGKKLAGRLLDGVEHNAYPEVA